ncbi:MOSC domain-containing protein [Nocardioides zeae]
MRVHRLGVALLKGAQHPARPTLRFDAAGPGGDRLLCALDADRRTVLRTVAHPRLLAARAHLVDEDRGLTGGWTLRAADDVATGPAVTDGSTVEVDYWGRRVTVRPLVASPHTALLSEHLGRDVVLALAPRGGIVYGAAVSVVTRATVRALVDAAGVAEPEEAAAARLRATLVVDDGTDAAAPFAEDSWAGRELVVGEARIRVRGPIVRCRVIDHDPATGTTATAGAGLLRALSGLRERPLAGVDAVVTRPGTVTLGDAVRVAAPC